MKLEKDDLCVQPGAGAELATNKWLAPFFPPSLLRPQWKDQLWTQESFERNRNKFPHDQDAFVLQLFLLFSFSDFLEVASLTGVPGVRHWHLLHQAGS